MAADHVTVPARGPSFFGRERERDHLRGLVRRASLATLTGVGGAGKTRLAAEIAAETPGEVCWCELASLSRDEDVAPAVAAALGRDHAGDATAVVADALAGSDVLLVLDNCEQVLEGAAALVEALARALPGVRVLATSRAPLGVEGEHVVAVGSLERDEAVELFADRARLVRWDFAVTDANRGAVAEICRRIDELPLAIELAAARVRSLAPEEIAERLGPELLARARGPERHRTLHGAIDWSYRLLDEEERLAFERMSVVASRCDLDAAQAICCGEALAVLDRLVERSLVVAVEDGGVTRYGMLETLREFARERLRERGEEDAARERHADHYAGVADRVRSESARRWSPAMLHEGIASFPEVRAACAWAMERDDSPSRVARLVAPLWGLAHSRHATEIGALCEEALGRWPEAGEDRETILGVAATAHFAAGDPAASRGRAAEALSLRSENGRPAVVALRALALLSYVFDAEPRETLERLDDVVQSAREQGVPTIASEMSVLAAQALAASGEAAEAVELAETMLAESEEASSPLMRAWSVYVLGTVLMAEQPRRAETCLREALELAEDGGYTLVAANSLRQLGRLAADAGRAACLFADAVERFAALDDRPQLWDALRSAAPLLARVGLRAMAAEVLSGAAADPRARAVPPLEAGEIAALRSELEAELAVAPAPRAATLVQRVLDELRALAGGAEPAAAPAAPAGSAPNTFRLDGELWTLAFAGRSVHMPDLKGLHDLARLLAAPEQEVHCLDLAGGGSAAGAPRGHAGELLDDQARAAYKQRLGELREELELAQAANDTVRAERMRDEIDAIADSLGAAFGLGGRARKAGDTAERARSAVTWRIRSALKRIEDAHPALGRHLRNSVSTGTYCVYRPERATDWRL